MSEHQCGFRDCAICGELVVLDGTEQQVAWANEIRTERIERMVRGLAQLETSSGGSDHIRQRRQARSLWMRQALRAARQQSSAAWWIDSRSNTIETLREVLAGPDPRARFTSYAQ